MALKTYIIILLKKGNNVLSKFFFESVLLKIFTKKKITFHPMIKTNIAIMIFVKMLSDLKEPKAL
jgi:hypothetical protein